MTDVAATIVIPTFNRVSMLENAINTAINQTVYCEVIISDHGSEDETPELVKSYGDRVTYLRREVDNGPFFSWLDGVINASTEYIHITYDDDWINPLFIEKCLSIFNDQCAYVFSAYDVHGNDKIESYYHNVLPTGIHPVKLAEKILFHSDLSISPGCGLFRKNEMLKAIYMNLPVSKFGYHGAGPDLFIYLSPLLEYKSFGFINESLAHLFSHENSITINALGDPCRRQGLKNCYDEVKKYYLLLKAAKDSDYMKYPLGTRFNISLKI